MNLIQCHHTVQKMVVAEVVLVVASGRQIGTEVTKLWEALHYCTCNLHIQKCIYYAIKSQSYGML